MDVRQGVFTAAAAAAVASQWQGEPAPPAEEPVAPIASIASDLTAVLGRFLPPVVDIVVARAILIILTIVVGWLAMRLASFIIKGVGLRVLQSRMAPAARPRACTLAGLFYSVAKYVIIFATFIVALRQAHLDPTPFLGGAAIIALAVSFGSQGLVQDVVTGAFVMLEDQFAIGDHVELGGKSGVVVGMSIRIVTIRDMQGNLQNIPYRTITVVTNSSRTTACLVLDVFLAKEEDSARAAEVLSDALKTLAGEMKPLVRSCGVEGLISAGTPFRAVRATVDAMPGRADFIQAEITDRVTKAFAAASIEIAAGKIRFFSKPAAVIPPAAPS